MMRRKTSEAAQRQVERRQREDDAPRLHDEVPKLKDLKFVIDEYVGSEGTPQASHTRPIIVASAPALFDWACSDKLCQDGGHDMTQLVMRELHAGAREFEGDHACNGSVGPTRVSCMRTMKFVAHATYSE